MEFCLLGPLVVRRGGQLLPIRAGKQRALLAALLLRANLLVPIDELTDALWAAAPPPSARVTLQNHVRRLRDALGEAGRDRISTQPGGYQISVRAAELDVTRFETLLREARAAAATGEWEKATGQARAALSLWRGRPLADVESETLALRELPRLFEMRLQAAETAIAADVRQGRHGAVIGELRQLVLEEPLRERFRAMLMLALYGDGRQAEALAAYQDARTFLVTELGAEPGPELRGLQRRILAGDPDLAAPGIAVAGIAAKGIAIPEPGRVIPRQLPIAVSHFVGRAAELKALDELRGRLGEHGAPAVAVICGTAGVGKTTLAVHWAQLAAEHFPDGQLYLNLRGFDPSGKLLGPAAAVRGLLDGLQVQPGQIPAGVDAQASLYRSLLAGQRMLVLLDNAHDADQVRPLLPGASGCLTLVTSRSQLPGLVAEQDASPLPLDMFTNPEAREFLARRLGSDRLAAESGAVTDLIGLCGRLPLALAIVAARAALGPGSMLASLAGELQAAPGRLSALDAGDATVSARAVFSWSYRDLSEPVARMFRLVGLHPGPDIGVRAAASLAGISLGQAGTHLAELARGCLVSQNALRRYSAHDLLRAYAAELADSAERECDRRAALHRLLDYYLHGARAAALVMHPNAPVDAAEPPRAAVIEEAFSDYGQAAAWLEAERPALVASIAQAATTGFDSHAVRLTRLLVAFLDERGYWADQMAIQQVALRAAERLGDLAAQRRTMHGLGRASHRLGAVEESHRHFTDSLDLSRRAGDRAGESLAHIGLSMALADLGRLGDARDHCVQALRLSEAIGDKSRQAASLNNLGWYHAALGDGAEAAACCQRAIALYQEIGYRLGEAMARDSLGRAYERLGDSSQAVECYQAAINMFTELGAPHGRGLAFDHLGDAWLAAGHPDLARKAWTIALHVYDEIRHRDADEIRRKLRQL